MDIWISSDDAGSISVGIYTFESMETNDILHVHSSLKHQKFIINATVEINPRCWEYFCGYVYTFESIKR